MPKYIERMNKTFFMGAFLSPVIVPVIIIAFSLFQAATGINRQLDEGLFVPIAILYVIFMFIMFILFHYRMWAAVYDERVKTSPGMAVFLLFVPIYNFIWIFKFYFGFVQHYNENVERYGQNTGVKPIEGYAFFAMPILSVMGAILEFVEAGAMSIIVNILIYIVFLVVVWQTCNAVNAMTD
ncbi:MAG: hypothetical protein JW885_03295 [Deltaproteobacteria bacterium]|nr:hypothetical protein [Candidatus Zymogenaceae bacterium]